MLVACVALPAAAQSPRDSAVGHALSRFRPGQPIQVALERNRWTGRLERVGGDTLFFASRGQLPMAIRFNAIDTLWRRSNHTIRGVWNGGATGALLGGFAAAAGESSNDTNGNAVHAGLLGAAIGGALGAITGGVIGSLVRRWQLAYP
jgi:hypothetical protein